MPHFSAFARFGHLRFSKRPPVSQRIYEEMRQNAGPENWSGDFYSLASARMYANAMLFGRTHGAIERGGNQFRPNRALELLPRLEREYGIRPDPGERIPSRRQTLAAHAKIPRGARRDNVMTVMTELLGDDFLGYYVVPFADLQLSTLSPVAVGVYDRPGTERTVFRLTQSVATIGSPLTRTFERVTGAAERPLVGSKVIVDPGHFGRVEAVTIDGATDSTITATFLNPHDAGTAFATGRHPFVASSKRHDVFVLSQAANRNRRLRNKAHRAARRLLRAVSTWNLTEETAPGQIGPFTLNVSGLGLITFGTVTYS